MYNTKVALCLTNLMIFLHRVHQSTLIQLVQFQKVICIQNSTGQRFPKTTLYLVAPYSGTTLTLILKSPVHLIHSKRI